MLVPSLAAPISPVEEDEEDDDMVVEGCGAAFVVLVGEGPTVTVADDVADADIAPTC